MKTKFNTLQLSFFCDAFVLKIPLKFRILGFWNGWWILWVRYNSWTQMGTEGKILICKSFDPIIIVSVSPLTTTFRVNKPQDSQRRHRSRTWSVFNTSWQPLGWMNLCITAWPHFWRTVNHSQLNSDLTKKTICHTAFFFSF